MNDDEEKIEEVEAKLDGKPSIKQQVRDYIRTGEVYMKFHQNKKWPDHGSDKFVDEYQIQSFTEDSK
jgi:hypothetical protein